MTSLCYWCDEPATCSFVVFTTMHNACETHRRLNCRGTYQNSLFDPMCGESVAVQGTLFEADPAPREERRVADLPGQTILF